MENTVNPESVIYPEILFVEDEKTMVVFTRLRKRSNGVYYFWDYKQRHIIHEDERKIIQKEKLLVQLHFEVYLIQVMGKMDFKIRKSVLNELTGEMEQIPLFEKDKSQKSEEVRLIEKYQLSNQTN